MSVPKSRREEHDFMANHKLHDIRRLITELAINDFGYDQQRLERKIQKFEDSLVNLEPERKREVVARMRQKNEGFFADFVEEETKETRDILRKAVFEFELGNSIFPTGETKLEEYKERRKLKAYKRLLDRGGMPYEDVEQAYKSWMGEYVKLMSKKQTRHMKQLYKELFGKEPKWKK